MNVYLDVDEVICDFMAGLYKKYPEIKSSHDESQYDLPNVPWEDLYKDATFWIALKVLDRPTVKIAGYVSHRPFPTYITEFWFHINRFTKTDVYHTKTSSEKVDLLLKCNCDLYVDDKPQTFNECLHAGLNVYLYNQPWNQHIKTDRRISKLAELEELI